MPRDTPCAPRASTAAMPRPSMMPPDAITGTSGPTASTTCGTSASVPTSAGAAGPPAAPTPNVPRWPPASAPCVITAVAPRSTARRASSTVVTSGSRCAPAARVASATGAGSSNVPITVTPAPSAASTSDAGGSAAAGSGGSSGKPSSRRNGFSTSRMRARSPVAGVGCASCTLTPIGPSGASSPRPGDVAQQGLGRHARGAEHPEASRARHRGHELRGAGAVRHARQQDGQAHSEQVAHRRAQVAHTLLDAAQRLMSPSVA